MALLCEKRMTLGEAQSALLIPQISKPIATLKPHMEIGKIANTIQTLVEITTM